MQAALALVYVVVTEPLDFVLLRFLEGAVSANVLPADRALVADAAPEEQRGAAYGLFGAAMNAGFVLWTLGYASAFVGSCAFRLIALVGRSSSI